MSFFKDKVVIITGATSGIGRALAIEMAAPGVQLIIAARRMEELIPVREECLKRGASCLNLHIDLGSPDSIALFTREVSSRFSKVDVLVNNAGISQRSLAEETPLSIDRKIMEVNFFGQVDLTKSLWSLLVESAHANIVLMSSLVGTFGFTQRSAYSASKHALEGFFESWMIENKRKNIFFTTISPGRIQTNISYSAMLADGTQHQKMDKAQAKGIKPEICARKIIRGIQNDKRKVYVLQWEMIMVILRRCFPPLFFSLVKKAKTV